MLWLAGLMGLVTVGAASLAMFVDTDDDPDLEQSGSETPDGTVGDLLDMIEAPANGEIIAGGPQDEDIAGAGGDDQINGYEGDDAIDGGAGGDTVLGAGGNDTLSGGDGPDLLHGGDGTDAISGGTGADTLFGHDGDDSLAGGAGDDSLNGSAGDDLVQGDAGDDAVHGGLGDDTLFGGSGHDTLFGGWGDDVLDGTVPDQSAAPVRDIDMPDYLNGGGGGDTILAGPGDIVTPGDGLDVLVLGDWVLDGPPAEILDFDRASDRLVMLWDQTGTPEIEVVEHATLADAHDLVINGSTIATIHHSAGLQAGDIALLSRAQAAEIGLRLG